MIKHILIKQGNDIVIYSKGKKILFHIEDDTYKETRNIKSLDVNNCYYLSEKGEYVKMENFVYEYFSCICEYLDEDN